MSDAWQADVRPIPPELAPEYVHADFSPTPVADSLQGVTVGQRIDEVMRERLKDMFGQVR